jgi:ketosteroid isomerase-like protein
MAQSRPVRRALLFRQVALPDRDERLLDGAGSSQAAAGASRAAAEGVAAEVVARFVEAWEAVDLPQLATLLREDAVMTMPPAPLLFRGPQAIVDFFATVPLEGALDRTRVVTTRANGHPTLAVYFPNESGGHSAYGLMVLVTDGDRIAEIVGFADPSLFPVFRLPVELAG